MPRKLEKQLLLRQLEIKKKVIKVDKFGEVTAVKNGRAEITVRTSSGKKTTCKVTVKK